MQSLIHSMLAVLVLPKVGLPAIFLISLVSATLLPLGSEPAVFGYVQIAPHMFWPAVLVATVGNTLGGIISYAMGAGAETAWHRWQARQADGGATRKAMGLVPDATGSGMDAAGAGVDAIDSGVDAAGSRLDAATTDREPTGPRPALAGATALGQMHSRTAPGGRWQRTTTHWFQRFGPPALLLSWLPGIGDPLCAVAGWLRLPFWPSVAYMAIGKFLRYVVMTTALLHAWPWISDWL